MLYLRLSGRSLSQLYNAFFIVYIILSTHVLSHAPTLGAMWLLACKSHTQNSEALADPDADQRESGGFKGGSVFGKCHFNETTLGGWRSLWTPDTSLEPQNGPIHLHGSQWYPYHRPPADRYTSQ